MTEVAPPAPVQPLVEPVKTPERELPNPHFRAVHGRILLGSNSLDPDNKNIAAVTKEALAAGSPQVLNECATNCRRKTALVEKDKLETEIASRIAKNTLVLKQDLSKIKGFDQAKAARWQAALTKLFGKHTAGATEAEVKALFDKYFYSKDQSGNNSETDLFSEDVLRAFDGDLTAIDENADCIIWYARICGFSQDYSETVFKHQITAKALLKSHPDQLVSELNKQEENQPARINIPNEDEERILQFIWGNRGKPAVVAVPTPTEPIQPTQTEEEKRMAAEKAAYEQSRDQLSQFLTDPQTKLGQVNQGLKNIGLAEIKEVDLTSLRTDEGKRKRFIIDMILWQQRKIMVADKVLGQLPKEERQTLEYAAYQQSITQLEQVLAVPKPDQMTDVQHEQLKINLAKQIDEVKGEIDGLPKELIEKINRKEIKPDDLQARFNQQVDAALKTSQPEIDSEINTLRAQMYIWEGIEEEPSFAKAGTEEKSTSVVSDAPTEAKPATAEPPETPATKPTSTEATVGEGEKKNKGFWQSFKDGWDKAFKGRKKE